MTKNQPDKHIADTSEKPGEDIFSLPPLPPDLEIGKGDEDSGAKRIFNFACRGYYTAVYARDNRLSSRVRIRYLLSFEQERNEVLRLVRKLTESFDEHTTQDRVGFFKDWESFCERLVNWLKESLVNNTANLAMFLDLFQSQIPLLERTALMVNITWEKRGKLVEKILKQAEQKIEDIKQPAETEQEKKADEQKIINILKEYENEHGNKVGIGPADLECEVEMTWPQLRPVLDRLGRKGLIEGHKGDGYTSYWLSVEFDEDDPLKHCCNIKKFRLTEKGRKLYTKPPGTEQAKKREISPKDVPPPIDTKGLWSCPSLNKLREIDSNAKRDGIAGDKETLKRLKEYLTRRQKRKDIAETLHIENERIKTSMPCRSIFKQK